MGYHAVDTDIQKILPFPGCRKTKSRPRVPATLMPALLRMPENRTSREVRFLSTPKGRSVL